MNDKLPGFMPMTPTDGEKTSATTGLEFACNVQHPRPAVIVPGVGDRSTSEPGKVLVTCVVDARAGGNILVQVRHSDGTTLGVFLDPQTYAALDHCLRLANSQLVSLETIAKAPKPS